MNTIKHKAHRLLQRIGVDVVRLENTTLEYQAVADGIRASGASIVLDVGANEGQFGELVFDTGFKGLVISFEAIKKIHGVLQGRAKKANSRWIVAPCMALGRHAGTARLNLSGNSVSSSLLPMREEHVSALPESSYVGNQEVRMGRLDEIAPQLMPEHGLIYLKVDTQGYELEVLGGATQLLKRTAAIQIEMSLVPLYEGAPTFSEAMSHMDALKFELFSIITGFKNTRTGRLLQVDGIFMRREQRGYKEE